MTLIELKPRKALNKAFLKVKPSRSDIESFKKNLINLIDQINEAESEEFHKNLVSHFLRETYYGSNHSINVIYNGKDEEILVVEENLDRITNNAICDIKNLENKIYSGGISNVG